MIQMSNEEKEALKALYVEFDTPIDQFVQKRDRLVEMVSRFNKSVGGSSTPEEILHFMMNQRKRGLWPRLRRNYNGRNWKQAS